MPFRLTLVPAAAFLALSLHAAEAPKETERQPSEREIRRASQRLVGEWFVGGDAAKRCTIASVPESLVATNESGLKSKLNTAGPSEIVAVDWAGVRGNVRGELILWRNGMWWTRPAYTDDKTRP